MVLFAMVKGKATLLAGSKEEGGNKSHRQVKQI